MRQLICAICVLAIPSLSVKAENEGERQTVQKMSGAVNGLQYLLYLPENYKAAQNWPLVLFLHGSGERGSKIERVKKHGPPKLVAEGRKFPFILVSPQCPADQRWDAEKLGELISQLEKRYSVDKDRIYVTGLSMGGAGTWALVASDPERFAAIAPVCGRGNPASAKSFARKPAWVFHGARDRVVPLRESQRMVDAMKASGGAPKFTIYPEAGHDSWTAAYSNPKFYDWLLGQKRK
jgi:predicted peptidase